MCFIFLGDALTDGCDVADALQVQQNFEHLLYEAEVPLERILKYASVLYAPPYELKMPHSFLTFMKRAQFDPSKERYVPLTAFTLPGDEFCDVYARCDSKLFDDYKKSF